MSYKVTNFCLGGNWDTDEWPDEIRISHETRPTVARSYVPARACRCDGTVSWEWAGPTTYYSHELSCGHVATTDESEPPTFCGECGAQVMRP